MATTKDAIEIAITLFADEMQREKDPYFLDDLAELQEKLYNLLENLKWYHAYN